jgi:penicillin-binding protein 1C
LANRSRVFKAAFFVVGFAALLAASRLVLALIPYPELAAYRSRSYGLVIQDRNGAVLRVLPAEDGVKREWIDLEDIPPGAAGIFIRAEDRRFYFHPGVDPLAIAGSALRNFRAGRVVSGASTITMQLARLIRLHGPGVEGKLGEAWDALCLEARLSKKEILELWFNNIPFGSNIEGLSAMARARFGISAGLLDNSRAALLAVIPRRPALYDFAVNPDAAVSAALALVRDRDALLAAARESQLSAGAVFYAPHFTERIAVLMGGPGGRGPSVPWPPGGGVTGATPPLRGVVEARRAGTRGETSTLLNISKRLSRSLP